jgi:hypothetical protein
MTVLRPPCTKVRAIVFAKLDLEDGASRCPVALLAAGGDESAVGGETQAVRIAEAGGEDFQGGTTFQVVLCRQARSLPHLDTATHALIPRREIKPALLVRFEPDDEIMTARRGLHFIRDALVEVGFVIAIQIMQAGDLIATKHEELSFTTFTPSG